MTASDIDKILRRNFGNYDYLLSNIFFYGSWESDFICCSGSGYWYEVEIKISKSDFKADFKKTEKHHRFKNHDKEIITIPGHEKREYDRETRDWTVTSNRIYVVKNFIPNRFFYACPEGIIDKKDIPDYAGLFYCKPSENNTTIGLKQIKPAKFLHKRKEDYSKLLLHKYYQRYLAMKHEMDLMKYEFDRIRRYYNPALDEETELTLF